MGLYGLEVFAPLPQVIYSAPAPFTFVAKTSNKAGGDFWVGTTGSVVGHGVYSDRPEA